MTDDSASEAPQEVEATIRIGKAGIEPVVDELRSQLDDRPLVKAKFLRSARAGSTTEELARELANSTSSEVVETRGHTVVFRR